MNPIHVLLSAFLLPVTLISYAPLILFSVMQQHNWGPCCLVFEVPDQTQLDTHTVGMSSLDKWSARRRGRDLHYTQQAQETDIQAVSGIHTREPGNRAAIDLRPHGRRRRRFFLIARANVSYHQPKFLHLCTDLSLLKGRSGLNFSEWITTISWIYSLHFIRTLIFNCCVLDT